MEVAEVPNKPKQQRYPVAAFFLSVFFPGLGQIYNGQLVKGIVLFIASIVLTFTAVWTRYHYTYTGLVILFCSSILLYIAIVIDAVIGARRHRTTPRAPYNQWYYHLLFALVIWGVLYVIDLRSALHVKAFRVYSESMTPTLMPGDLLMPVTNPYTDAKPDYGDLVLFNHDDSTVWVHRIMALPGDEIALEHNEVFINGKKLEAREIGPAAIENGALYEELLPNAKKVRIYKQIYDVSPSSDLAAIRVPPGQFFVMGDNRNNALDSRYEGPIKESAIVGRALYTYWGSSSERMGIVLK